MSSKLLTINRLNNVSNFNFFFQNTKKKLVIDQNFINNQYLIINRNLIKTSKTSNHKVNSKFHKTLHNANDVNSNLTKVTSKILTCQEPEAMDQSKVPFKITPKSIPHEATTLKSLIKPYIKLTKPNLTVLVTLSSICSYALSPYTVSLPELMFLSAGTALCSGAANAINMAREPEFDRKMIRTSNRPIVIGKISSKDAYKFAAISGTVGCLMLYIGVNPVVSALGFLNIILYAWIYTSLKRISILNTWVGAIVGAIPPLMGWAASSSLLHPGAWCLAGLLYAWQFPHFNALSHNIAKQYKDAGYVMTAAENPKMNARVSLRYSILMFPLCFGLSYFDVTDWFFQFDSFFLNGWLTVLAYQFWKQQNQNYSTAKGPTAEGINLANSTARKLFWASVWHLPGILILAMLHKKGQWDRLFHYLGFDSEKKDKSFNYA